MSDGTGASIALPPRVDDSPPVVSVLVPTCAPWPALAGSLESLLSQETSLQYEILILDGHGAGLAAPPSHPAVRWFQLPGSDTFVLRAAGLAAARGTIVALSEDHCVAAPDWVEAVANAHRDDERPALLGPTVNHPESSLLAMDRANFLLTFAGQNRSRIDIGWRRLPVPTNLSLKRAALPKGGLAPGELEYPWLAHLRDTHALGVAPSAVLQHKQSWGADTLAVHLASGRSYGASIREWPWREKFRWLLRLPLLPLQLARLAVPDLMRGAGGAPASVRDACCLGVLILANVIGQVQGAIFGPGASRQRL
jgi:hypothetical protein